MWRKGTSRLTATRELPHLAIKDLVKKDGFVSFVAQARESQKNKESTLQQHLVLALFGKIQVA